jgi:hypothetical protein
VKKNQNRNKVDYGSEFLYCSFDATGYHFNNQIKFDKDCENRNTPWTECSGNLVRQLHRIQGINYSIDMDRVDINQLGSYARVDNVVLNTPSISIDFEYCIADAYNEQVLGFIVDGETQAIAKHLSPDGVFGCNFFIATTKAGHQIVNANLEGLEDDLRVIGIGNAFLSQYAVNAEIGSIPKARMTFDAFTIATYRGACNLPLPSIDPSRDLQACDLHCSIPDTYQSFVYEKINGMNDIVYQEGAGALRPGDIKISLDDGGLLSQQSSSLKDHHLGAAHVQGFSINMPIGNTKIQKLGSTFAFARVLNFPSNIEIQITALVNELKKNKSLSDFISCPTEKHNLVISLEDCRGLYSCGSDLVPSTTNMAYYFKGAIIDVESFESNVSDNKMVNLTFNVSVSSVDDDSNGMFIYGKSHFPDQPKILNWGSPI